MNNRKDGDEEQLGTHAVLSKRSRIVASAASIVLGLAGLAAVFLSGNQAGTALVMAVAALFGLVGLGGHLPTKLKFGDNEITMPIVDAVSKKIASSSPQEAGELAERVILALPTVASGQGRSRGLFYERMVRSVVLQLESEGAPFRLVDQDPDSSGVDFSLYEQGAERGKRRLMDVTVKYFEHGALPLSSVGTFPRFLEDAKHAVGSMLVTNACAVPKLGAWS